MSWYCAVAVGHPVHHSYHEEEYGVPVTDETVLFERLCLEIFQAGLSWEITLKRRPGLNAAFAGFDPGLIATWGEAEAAALLADARIIRNRRKVAAVFENARRFVALRPTGGLPAWLAARHPLSKAGWVKEFKTAFVFTGGEIVGEFLMSIGYLPNAHDPQCPVYARIAGLNPPWMQAVAAGFRYDD